MTSAKPVVGVVMTMLDLYRQRSPEAAASLEEHWRFEMTSILSEAASLQYAGIAFTEAEVSAAVEECERSGVDLLLVLPMSYAPSGAAAPALLRTGTPLVLVSSARDSTLPPGLTGDHIMANHAVHGVQDLANVLARGGRRFEIVAGHPSEDRFRRKLVSLTRTGAAANVLRRGRAGRIGTSFEGMLDFKFTPKGGVGFEVVEIDPSSLTAEASSVGEVDADGVASWARERFETAGDLDDETLAVSARWSAALERIVARERLDAVSMNFLEVARAASPGGTVPFLGACRLMSTGTGYAGEGDVLTAMLCAALGRIEARTTFTEMFCPDYARAEMLLSHMGECNPALASPGARPRLMAKPFPWDECFMPAVPVFQLVPGKATLVSLTEWPEESFRLVAAHGEVLDAPNHPNLTSPWTRIGFGRDLQGFLEDYSRAGGTHHLALVYGDIADELAALATCCGMGLRIL